VRACVRACVCARARVRCVDTRGPGPSRSRAELTCEIRRSSEPGLPACQGNIILGDDAYTPRGGYLASTRRLGGAGRGKGGGRKGEKGEKGDSREEARVRYKDEAEGRGYTGRASERASERAGGRNEGEHRRRRFNQRGLSASIFPLARFPAKPGSVGNCWRRCRGCAIRVPESRRVPARMEHVQCYLANCRSRRRRDKSLQLPSTGQAAIERRSRDSPCRPKYRSERVRSRAGLMPRTRKKATPRYEEKH